MRTKTKATLLMAVLAISMLTVLSPAVHATTDANTIFPSNFVSSPDVALYETVPVTVHLGLTSTGCSTFTGHDFIYSLSNSTGGYSFVTSLEPGCGVTVSILSPVDNATVRYRITAIFLYGTEIAFDQYPQSENYNSSFTYYPAEVSTFVGNSGPNTNPIGINFVIAQQGYDTWILPPPSGHSHASYAGGVWPFDSAPINMTLPLRDLGALGNQQGQAGSGRACVLSSFTVGSSAVSKCTGWQDSGDAGGGVFYSYPLDLTQQSNTPTHAEEAFCQGTSSCEKLTFNYDTTGNKSTTSYAGGIGFTSTFTNQYYVSTGDDFNGLTVTGYQNGAQRTTNGFFDATNFTVNGLFPRDYQLVNPEHVVQANGLQLLVNCSGNSNYISNYEFLTTSYPVLFFNVAHANVTVYTASQFHIGVVRVLDNGVAIPYTFNKTQDILTFAGSSTFEVDYDPTGGSQCTGSCGGSIYVTTTSTTGVTTQVGNTQYVTTQTVINGTTYNCVLDPYTNQNTCTAQPSSVQKWISDFEGVVGPYEFPLIIALGILIGGSLYVGYHHRQKASPSRGRGR
jgi:hypothetical protein